MNIVYFDYVNAIAKYGTISKAAEMLFISQPALSQGLRKLERDLGTKLFIRQGNRMILTESGTAFIEEGSLILRAYARLEERISHISAGKEEIIRLGVSRFYGRLPHIIHDFINKHPEVQLEISEGLTLELESLFIDGALDLCIIPASPFTSRYENKTLFDEELLIAVPPGSCLNQYSEEREGLPCLDLKYLNNTPFVSLTSNQRIYDMCLDLCEEAGFKPNILCTVFSYDTLLMLVSLGLGAGFVSSLQTAALSSMSDPPKCYHIITNRSVNRSYVLLLKEPPGKLAGELADSITALKP